MGAQERDDTRPSLAPFGLSTRPIVWSTCIVMCICAAIQIGLGVNLAVLVLATIATIIGLAGFAWLGADNLGAWLSLLYVLGNVIVAFVAKTLLGQPADSNLDAPILSFALVAIACVALLLALAVVGAMKFRTTFLNPTLDASELAFISWMCFCLGFVFWLLNRRFQDPDGSGFGGFGMLINLFLMGIIARTAYLLESRKGSMAIDPVLVLMIVVSMTAGLIDNHKSDLALPIASYFATVIFFRGRLPRKLIIVATIAGAFFISIVAPLTHVFRALQIQEMTLDERVALLKTETLQVFAGGTLRDDYSVLATEAFEGGIYDYFGDSRGQMIVGRYAAIEQIDPVAAAVEQTRPLGGKAVWPALLHSVPAFVYPEKPKDPESYVILVDLGLIDPAGGHYPALPLIGQSFAGYGFLGATTIPFLTFLLFLGSLKKVTGALRKNIYAIFFFCQFLLVYGHQGDLSQYAGAVLRAFPVFVILFLAISRSFQFFTGSPHAAHRLGTSPGNAS